MSNFSKWIVRSAVVALVLFGAAFAHIGWSPGTNSAEASTSSAAQSRSFGGTTRPTATPTQTATSTKTATSTQTATSSPPAGGANEAACLNTQEAAFLADINAYRKSKGLGALVA